jgi:2-polyprenyl-3-methyl-5-hydroxy-6-metoxy-1,4-benzoquinol methylase
MRAVDPWSDTMKSKAHGAGYNERLFSGGFRSQLHLARFRWFAAEVAKRGCATDRVLELGCFDGKLLDFVPASPSRYVGFDANWEGGLDLARAKWAHRPSCSFHLATSPEDMRLAADDRFDIAVAMETLEHVPPDMVDGYLRQIADHLDGYLFITVPNETGPVFLGKWAAKAMLGGDPERYSASEVLNATLGRTDRVQRREHKGFNYRKLVAEIENHFEVIEVGGHPLGFLPPAMCFGIGVVARRR